MQLGNSYDRGAWFVLCIVFKLEAAALVLCSWESAVPG